MTIIKDLENIGLFSHMNEDELGYIARLVSIRSVSKGSILFFEGDPAQGLHYIIRGRVQMSKASLEGKQHIIQIFGSGEILAEAVIFSGEPYPATAEALEPTELYFIASEAIEKLILEQPRLALNIIRILSQRLRDAQERLKAWAFTDASQRVAQMLVGLAVKHGRQTNEGIVLDLELTHTQLAALSGLTRETVSRALSSFRAAGLILGTGRELTILDVSRLEAEADV